MKNGQIQTNQSKEKEENSYQVWWKNRSKVEKKLVIASIIASAALLLILFIYLLVANEPQVCTSSTCVRTSMELLNYVDINVDPCEDFYRFSCGNFLENTNLDNRGSRSMKNIMEEEIQSQIRNMLVEQHDDDDLEENSIGINLAKKFYRACMNESAIEAEGLKRMREIFMQIGGWPTLNAYNWREDLFDWKETVYKLRQMGINSEFFLILSLEKDKTDSNKYILSIKDPAYSPSKISSNIKSMYLNYMVDVAVLVGANRDQAKKDQNEVMQFLLKLAKISEEAKTANGTRTYNPLSLSEMQYAFPEVAWQEYINKILAPAAQITYDDIINLPHPLYLKKLLDVLKHTSKRIIANFISWHILQRTINYLPSKILDRAYEYLHKVNGKVTRQQRWSVCVNAVETKMSTIISAAYIQRYFDNETRHRANSMIRNIKYQFKENLHKLDWLDGKTKDMALEKVVSSIEDIATVDKLIELNKYYEKVEILEDNLLTSILNLDYVNTNIQYGKLRLPAAKEFYFEKPRSVTGLNIVYAPKENVLNIPAGLFQGIFYQKDRPEYMNYGALGTVVAHEISHIITEAEYRSGEGDLRSWWSSHSLLQYDEKLQCLSNQYGKFIIGKIQQNLTRTTSRREEDMADLAGMKIAYDTYNAWVQDNGIEPQLPGLNFSSNQLFWISSAIHHCAKYSNETLQRYMLANNQLSPGQFRVNGVLQNLYEFADDFGCPSGSGMNPENKCQIW